MIDTMYTDAHLRGVQSSNLAQPTKLQLNNNQTTKDMHFNKTTNPQSNPEKTSQKRTFERDLSVRTEAEQGGTGWVAREIHHRPAAE